MVSIPLWDGGAAARRIGELVPPEKTGPKPDKEFIRASDKLPVSRQRLSEFRKLAEIKEQARVGKV